MAYDDEFVDPLFEFNIQGRSVGDGPEEVSAIFEALDSEGGGSWKARWFEPAYLEEISDLFMAAAIDLKDAIENGLDSVLAKRGEREEETTLTTEDINFND